MRRLQLVLAAATVLAAGCGTGGGLVSIGAGLKGPAGLHASVYARGLPQVAAFAFDPQGRLWVSTAAYRDDGHDGLYLVTAAGASPVEVVPGLHTPLGLLWYQGSLFLASRDGVVAYRGFDGAKFASSRPIVTLPAGVGEVNQLVLAPDGRMQMGISAPCDHCVPASKWSAAVVSFRPDGSDLRVDARGIRAPVGLIYYPRSSDLFVTINQRDDLGAATPGDWLAVVRPGQAWGFPACYGQGGAPCAGTPQPTAVLDKHAAVIGVAIVTGQLGPTVGTAAIVAEWAVGKVQQVALSASSSGYTAHVSALLAGLKNPVPVALAADGSLLVGDWGTGIVYRVAG